MEKFLKLTKMQKMGIILLNDKVVVIIFIILIR